MPALEAIYRFKQRICCVLLEKGWDHSRCESLARRFRGTSPRSVVAGSHHW